MRSILIILIFAPLFIYSQQRYETHSLDTLIKTIQVYPFENPLAPPVITQDKQLVLSFDQMSNNPKNYNYKIIHCNADWTQSSLAEVEYIEGFANGILDDYQHCFNTAAIYTNYQLLVPNNDFNFKVSGNYALILSESNDFSHPQATICFSIAESTPVSVSHTISANTVLDINGKYQQLDIDVNHSGYEIRDPFSELKVVVKQNRRTDNAVLFPKPTYTSNNKQSFTRHNSLVFEGGNLYRSIDISSEYTYGAGIQSIRFIKGEFIVDMVPSDLRVKKSTEQGRDASGAFIINRQGSDYASTEADYMYVHFKLPMDTPFLDGSIYLLGDFFNNKFTLDSRMDYNFKERLYEKIVLLKQGGYNFQYAFVPKGSNVATLQRTEGSYWQTNNEYAIYVYHRPWGERYDKLVAYKIIK